jgi:hypothetical protein
MEDSFYMKYLPLGKIYINLLESLYKTLDYTYIDSIVLGEDEEEAPCAERIRIVVITDTITVKYIKYNNTIFIRLTIIIPEIFTKYQYYWSIFCMNRDFEKLKYYRYTTSIVNIKTIELIKDTIYEKPDTKHCGILYECMKAIYLNKIEA